MFCINSSVEGHLGSFHLLAVINKAAMNIVEHVSLLYIGASFVYMPSSGIDSYSGRTISNFLRNHQTDSNHIYDEIYHPGEEAYVMSLSLSGRQRLFLPFQLGFFILFL